MSLAFVSNEEIIQEARRRLDQETWYYAVIRLHQNDGSDSTCTLKAEFRTGFSSGRRFRAQPTGNRTTRWQGVGILINDYMRRLHVKSCPVSNTGGNPGPCVRTGVVQDRFVIDAQVG